MNNIDENDPSSYWEVLAHESAHVMQACMNDEPIYKPNYHPRILRSLKQNAPHLAELLNEYRGAARLKEMEAFDMELKTPKEVKDNFTYFCIDNNPNNDDFSDQEISKLKNLLGGEERYQKILLWAQSNLSKQEITEFDSIIESGTTEEIEEAILTLGDKYSQSDSQESSSKLTIKEVDKLQNLVGGKEKYNNLLLWAQENKSFKYVQRFDELIETGDYKEIESMILKLNEEYEQAISQENFNDNELSDQQLVELFNLVGGEEKYKKLVDWAYENLSGKKVDEYNEALETGSYNDIKKEILKLQKIYDSYVEKIVDEVYGKNPFFKNDSEKGSTKYSEGIPNKLNVKLKCYLTTTNHLKKKGNNWINHEELNKYLDRNTQVSIIEYTLDEEGETINAYYPAGKDDKLNLPKKNYRWKPSNINFGKDLITFEETHWVGSIKSKLKLILYINIEKI